MRLLAGTIVSQGAELVFGLNTAAISAYAALLTASGSFLVGLGKLISIIRSRSKNQPIEAEELRWLREEIARAHEHHDHDHDDEDEDA